jgi:hypothetical protein
MLIRAFSAVEIVPVGADVEGLGAGKDRGQEKVQGA